MSQAGADLLSHTDYKEFLKRVVDAPEQERGLKARLAAAARCERSYLSQVLNGSAHLTPDHALGIANCLGLNERRSEYFLALVHHARAASPELRRRLEHQLEKLRRADENLGERFDADRVKADADLATYYGSWLYSALHILLTIPGYNQVAPIATRLGVPPELVEAGLERLIALDLARFDAQKRRWEPTVRQLHVPAEHPAVLWHHQNWRQLIAMRAGETAQRVSRSVRYTSVYSLSARDLTRLRRMTVDWIEQGRDLAGRSKEETLAVLCCDLVEF